MFIFEPVYRFKCEPVFIIYMWTSLDCLVVDYFTMLISVPGYNVYMGKILLSSYVEPFAMFLCGAVYNIFR